MTKNVLPLKEVSIDEIFVSGEKSIYEIPIYQRNYAWEKDEIVTLVQDVYDSLRKTKQKCIISARWLLIIRETVFLKL